MRTNVGTVDRVARGVLGLAVVGAGFALHSWLGAIGLVLLGTAAVSRCPIYLPFGISTRRLRERATIRS